MDQTCHNYTMTLTKYLLSREGQDAISVNTQPKRRPSFSKRFYDPFASEVTAVRILENAFRFSLAELVNLAELKQPSLFWGFVKGVALILYAVFALLAALGAAWRALQYADYSMPQEGIGEFWRRVFSGDEGDE